MPDFTIDHIDLTSINFLIINYKEKIVCEVKGPGKMVRGKGRRREIMREVLGMDIGGPKGFGWLVKGKRTKGSF